MWGPLCYFVSWDRNLLQTSSLCILTCNAELKDKSSKLHLLNLCKCYRSKAQRILWWVSFPLICLRYNPFKLKLKLLSVWITCMVVYAHMRACMGFPWLHEEVTGKCQVFYAILLCVVCAWCLHEWRHAQHGPQRVFVRGQLTEAPHTIKQDLLVSADELCTWVTWPMIILIPSLKASLTLYKF